MSDETRSNTTKNNAGKMPGGITGKGFVKGDPRINRKGRPRTFDQLRRLAISILSEPAKGADGQPIVIDGHIATNVEIILRTAMRSPRFAQLLLEVAYGKVPDRVEVSGRDGAPIEVRAYDYYAAAAAIAARPNGDSS
jgi:hypothetical protein